MKRFITSVTSLALLAALAGASALAQTASPAPMGPLANALGYFAGTWNCNGGLVTDKPRAATVAWEWELGNTMLERQVNVPALGKIPAYRSGNYSSYDPKKKHVVSTGVNMYGEWNVSWTAGWKGNKLTWTDVAATDNRVGKNIITKVDASTFDNVGYDSAGKVDFKAHCVKAPSQAEK